MDWHKGVEQDIQALGRTWKLSRCNRGVFRKFARYAEENLPNPIVAMTRVLEEVVTADHRIGLKIQAAELEAGMSLGNYEQMSILLTREVTARAAARMNYGSPEMLQLLLWPDAQVSLMHSLLMKHHPGTDEDTADDIVNELGTARVAQIIVEAMGHPPQEDGEKKGESSTTGLYPPPLTGEPSTAP